MAGDSEALDVIGGPLKGGTRCFIVAEADRSTFSSALRVREIV
jgi:hypothetical protein